MSAQQKFKLAFGGVRAQDNLPSRIEDLLKPDTPRLFYRHGENKLEMVLAMMRLRELPKDVVYAARVAREGQYDRSPTRPMRTTAMLRYHTKAEKRKRAEAERRRQQRDAQHDCAMRGCQQCADALKNTIA